MGFFSGISKAFKGVVSGKPKTWIPRLIGAAATGGASLIPEAIAAATYKPPKSNMGQYMPYSTLSPTATPEDRKLNWERQTLESKKQWDRKAVETEKDREFQKVLLAEQRSHELKISKSQVGQKQQTIYHSTPIINPPQQKQNFLIPAIIGLIGYFVIIKKGKLK